MFSQAAPAGSRLLRVQSGSQNRLRAWATSGGDHVLRVLLINDSLSSTALALIRTPRGFNSGAGWIERLRAPSAYAESGITLGGQRYATNTTTGVLRPPVLQPVAPRSGTYRVVVPASSAALLIVPAG
jgi:hypothetical protein